MEPILNKLMLNLRYSGITVTFPSGRTQIYGDKTAAKKLHVRFNTNAALNAVVRNPSVGFGEGYMNGDIIFEAGFFDELMAVLAPNKRTFNKWFKMPVVHALLRASNAKPHQKHNISHHYDIGNDFYRLWLDKSMTYSCGYFKTPSSTLEDAQEQKRRHILRKLNLQKGMSLLDIGSGWGSLLIMAAKEYGATGLGVTLSDEQLKHSREAAKKAGVSNLITFELANYQDLPAQNLQFDRVVSVGMFEHVGRADMRLYFTTVNKLLRDGGITVLHTISSDDKYGGTDAWLDRYIFPGGYIPAVREVVDLLPNYDMRMIDYESLRLHYALTLDEWRHRYESHAKNIKRDYGDSFYRMWDMYLAACSANFKAGGIDLSQFILIKGHSNDIPLTREYIYK